MRYVRIECCSIVEPLHLSLVEPTGSGSFRIMEKRNTDRRRIPLIVFPNAATDVTKNKFLIRESAKQHSIDRITLTRYLREAAGKGPTNANIGYSSQQSWNPCTICNIDGIAKEAYNIAFSKKNMESAIKATGVFPLNRHIYTNEDFLPAEVTNRSDPTVSDETQQIEKTIVHSVNPPVTNPFPEQTQNLQLE